MTRMRRFMGVFVIIGAATFGSPAESASVPFALVEGDFSRTEVGRAVEVDFGSNGIGGWHIAYKRGIAESVLAHTPATQVPLPTSAWLFVSGLAGIVWLSRASIFRRGMRSRSSPFTGKSAG